MDELEYMQKLREMKNIKEKGRELFFLIIYLLKRKFCKKLKFLKI